MSGSIFSLQVISGSIIINSCQSTCLHTRGLKGKFCPMYRLLPNNSNSYGIMELGIIQQDMAGALGGHQNGRGQILMEMGRNGAVFEASILPLLRIISKTESIDVYNTA